MKETFVIDFSLIDKWVETDKKEYLNKWLMSDDAYHAAVRISRMNKTKKIVPTYGQEVTVGGHYIHPELISYVYMGIRAIAEGYRKGAGASFYTYIAEYSLHYAARHMPEDMDYQSMDTCKVTPELIMATAVVPIQEHQEADATLGRIKEYVVSNYKGNNLENYLYYLDGKTHTEIAALTGRSIQSSSYAVGIINKDIRLRFKDEWQRGEI